MHTRKWLYRCLLLSSVLVPHLVLAQPAPQYGWPPDGESTIHRHTGFFFRPEFGFGYTSSSASQNGIDVAVKGGGVSLGLAVGGAVSENFIVGGQIWDVVAPSPDVTASNGSTSVSTSTSSNTSSGLVGYGLLLNWYLQPTNIYLAVTPSLTRLVYNDGTTSYATQWGFGVRAAVGKEWWVSRHWGLGVAGGLAYSSNRDSSAAGAPTWSTVAFNVGLSATFN